MALKHFASQVEENQANIAAQNNVLGNAPDAISKPILTPVPQAPKAKKPNEVITKKNSTVVTKEAEIEASTSQLQIDNTINPALNDIPLTWSDQQMLCALSAMQIRYGRPAEAIPYLMMIRKINPSNVESTRLLALSFMRLGRWQEAEVMVEELDYLQKSTANGVVDGLVLLYRSLVSFKTNKIADAKSWFGKFRKFNKVS